MEYNAATEEVTAIQSTTPSVNDSRRSRVVESLSILQDSFTQYYQSDSFPRSIPEARAQLDSLVEKIATPFVTVPSTTMRVLKWKPTSEEELEIAETKLLTCKLHFIKDTHFTLTYVSQFIPPDLKSSYQGRYVDIGPGWGLENNRMWTVIMDGPSTDSNDNKKNNNLSLVLIHGFGCGSGIWSLNYDSFAANRKVYAFDILGFGRSSRPNFSKSEVAEKELVESIERWRVAVGLEEKFILLGHSFGGYLSLAYALTHPEFIERLILADPWGVSIPSAESTLHSQIQLPPWVQVVGKFLYHTFSPLAALRAAGPWGPSLIQKLRSDISKKFEQMTGEENAGLILDYVYHCNAQDPPSGELAFRSLSAAIVYAKNPMVTRIPDLASHIDLTFIYGSHSWIDSEPGTQLKQSLTDRIVQTHTIHGAGHHVYADDLEIFNDLVNSTCQEVDDIISGVATREPGKNEVAYPEPPSSQCQIA